MESKVELTLDQMKVEFPIEWKQVESKITPLLESKDVSALIAMAKASKSTQDSWQKKIQKSRKNPDILRRAQIPLIESRLTALALNRFLETALRAKIEGKAPLSTKNRFLANLLFFETGLIRKPVSKLAFKLFWPFITQKGRLLSLLNEAGIYCFYSKPLIKSLSSTIRGMRCLEIAAGDGSLTRLLNQREVGSIATDDYSWEGRIDIPDSVERLDAVSALKKYQPEVVLCSWPPPGNSFEAAIFQSASVKQYYMIGSRHEYASGNWNSYRAQIGFSMSIDEHLSRLVLPSESDSIVVCFRRKP